MLGSAAFRFVRFKPSKRPWLDRLRSPLPVGRVGLWAEVVDDSDEVEPCCIVSTKDTTTKLMMT
jgi:hypothetical protein